MPCGGETPEEADRSIPPCPPKRCAGSSTGPRTLIGGPFGVTPPRVKISCMTCSRAARTSKNHIRPPASPPPSADPLSPRTFSVPNRPPIPLVADGVTAQFATAHRPDDAETHCRAGDLRRRESSRAPDLWGPPAEFAGSRILLIAKALAGPCNGMFQG